MTTTPRPNDTRRIFLNKRNHGGTRTTVDEIRACDHATDRAWRWKAQKMAHEYRVARVPVYESQRACSGWEGK